MERERQRQQTAAIVGLDAAKTPTTDNRPPTTALYSKFRNRVMFPITNEQGKVIAFTGRTLAADEKSGPKYLNSPETPIYSKSRVLFNIDKAKQAIRQLDYAILVEGQMDCISVYAADSRTSSPARARPSPNRRPGCWAASARTSSSTSTPIPPEPPPPSAR